MRDENRNLPRGRAGIREDRISGDLGLVTKTGQEGCCAQRFGPLIKVALVEDRALDFVDSQGIHKLLFAATGHQRPSELCKDGVLGA